MTERELLQKLVKTYFTNNCGENVFNLMKSAESLLATPPAAELARSTSNPHKGGTYAYLATEHYNEGWNACFEAMCAAPTPSTPAPVAMPQPSVVMRTHPNQAYVTLGFNTEDECSVFIKAVCAAPPTRLDVGDALSPSEVEEFARTVEEFDDCSETSTAYELLMDWARRGFLECEHFRIMPKGRKAIADRASPPTGMEAPHDS